tara:strand:- start:611 stop:775 length:165 start_codon:yes stop_codon:yes gene_type:complete
MSVTFGVSFAQLGFGTIDMASSTPARCVKVAPPLTKASFTQLAPATGTVGLPIS